MVGHLPHPQIPDLRDFFSEAPWTGSLAGNRQPLSGPAPHRALDGMNQPYRATRHGAVAETFWHRLRQLLRGKHRRISTGLVTRVGTGIRTPPRWPQMKITHFWAAALRRVATALATIGGPAIPAIPKTHGDAVHSGRNASRTRHDIGADRHLADIARPICGCRASAG